MQKVTTTSAGWVFVLVAGKKTSKVRWTGPHWHKRVRGDVEELLTTTSAGWVFAASCSNLRWWMLVPIPLDLHQLALVVFFIPATSTNTQPALVVLIPSATCAGGLYTVIYKQTYNSAILLALTCVCHGRVHACMCEWGRHYLNSPLQLTGFSSKYSWISLASLSCTSALAASR